MANSTIGDQLVSTAQPDQYVMPFQTTYIVALGILCVAITIGNILVLLTFCKDKSLRNSTGMIIMSLACCDLITGSVAVPSVMMTMIDHPALYFMRKGIGCNFSGVTVFSCFNCSLLILTLISIQRFFLITRPHSTFMTNKRLCLGAIVFVYFYSFGLTMVPLAPNFTGFALYPWSLSCLLDISRGDTDGNRTKYFTVFYNSVTCLVAGSSIFLTQVRILKEIFRRTQTSTGSGERGRQLQESRRFYATKMICCMVVGFLLCTIPIMIVLFIKVADTIPPKEYASFAAYLTWFNSLLNPIIYWYFNRSYRSSFGTSIRLSVSKNGILKGISKQRPKFRLRSYD